MAKKSKPKTTWGGKCPAHNSFCGHKCSGNLPRDGRCARSLMWTRAQPRDNGDTARINWLDSMLKKVRCRERVKGTLFGKFGSVRDAIDVYMADLWRP